MRARSVDPNKRPSADPAGWLATILLLCAILACVVPATRPLAAEVLASAPGLDVMEENVRRPDGGSARLLVARMASGSFLASAAGMRDALPGSGWSVLVNGGYFERSGRPTHGLADGDRQVSKFTRSGGVLRCRDGACWIVAATRFDEKTPFDLAVQSTPRLLAGGVPVAGIRQPSVVDGRAGVAIDGRGRLLVFATGPRPDTGLSFDQVREIMSSRFGARDVMMLDGGDSARLSIRIGSRNFESAGLSRPVPWRLLFRRGGAERSD